MVSEQQDKQEIEFQGRKAKRADSRERRLAILEATLRIIIREGMRGVRHRAVATEAGVPLAATTYYFKDINELISDAFNLYAENSLKATQKLKDESFSALEQFTAEQLAEPATRVILSQGLVKFTIEHINSQLKERDQRILEYAFRNEALRNPELAKLAAIPQRNTLAMIEKFFTLLDSKDPRADAEIVNGVIMQLEYTALINPDTDKLIHRTVSHTMEKLLAI